MEKPSLELTLANYPTPMLRKAREFLEAADVTESDPDLEQPLDILESVQANPEHYAKRLTGHRREIKELALLWVGFNIGIDEADEDEVGPLAQAGTQSVPKYGRYTNLAEYLDSGIKLRLAQFVGQPADKFTRNMMLRETDHFLQQQVRAPGNYKGVITAIENADTGEYDPAFSEVHLVYDGQDVKGVQYGFSPFGYTGYVTGFTELPAIKIV